MQDKCPFTSSRCMREAKIACGHWSFSVLLIRMTHHKYAWLIIVTERSQASRFCTDFAKPGNDRKMTRQIQMVT